MEGLKNCCYFFDLKLGCLLIAAVEAFCSIFKIYQSYDEMFKADTVMVTGDNNNMVTTGIPPESMSEIHQPNPLFAMVMATVTIFCALFLFVGAKLERKTFLLIWLYATVLCILIFMFRTLIVDLNPDDLLYNAISVGLEIYFAYVVLSYYLHLQAKRQGNASEIEVLYNASEA